MEDSQTFAGSMTEEFGRRSGRVLGRWFGLLKSTQAHNAAGYTSGRILTMGEILLQRKLDKRSLVVIDGTGPLSPRKKWEAIPERFRERILQNVWCSHCGNSVEIVSYRVYSAGRDIVLRGRCAVCGGEVARVVEQS